MAPARTTSERKSDKAKVTSLDLVESCDAVEVLEISGPRNVANSLAQLGIRVGEVLRVRRSAPLGGAILIETHERSVALGRGLARKVKVWQRP
jgi:Fe2+ transport system protein FeoA